ncbi:MAG: HEAT repeat domain-containing protein [Limisphaerales bacterium]
MKKTTMILALGAVVALAAGQILVRAHKDKAVERDLAQANQVSSKALPELIQALSRKDSALEAAYGWFCSQLPDAISGHLPQLYPAPIIRLNAAAALVRLGPAAKPAVPELIVLLQDDFADASAALSLGQIGPEASEAIPALMKAVHEGRPGAATALARVASSARAARSVLVASAGNGPAWLRHESAQALRKLGEDHSARTSVTHWD